MPNYSISIFSVVQKDEVLQEVGIFFFSLPPSPIYNIECPQPCKGIQGLGGVLLVNEG